MSKRGRAVAVVLVSLLLRTMIGQGPHSGMNESPMHGDFEAQRHWMEVTVNVPMNDWYVGSVNGNDLQYWGLDYPPLTAYHSWICGKVFQAISPSSVALGMSRRDESSETKTMMRLLALVSDLLTFIPSVACYYLSSDENVGGLLLALNAPALLLIDHGHFQFNCVAHGLVVLSLYFLLKRKRDFATAAIASAAFCCALNFKQMTLYYSPVFFFHLLGWAAHAKSLLMIVVRLAVLSITVVVSFGLIWFPFTLNGTALNVLTRLFPFERGIFEDKVANFWCSSNVVIKWKTMFTHQQLALLALGATSLCIVPACIKSFLDRTEKSTLVCLFAVSLAFFLFSFQVHEKSILLPLIPCVLMLNREDELFSLGFWFAIVSSLSMTPLYVKDKIVFTSACLSMLFIVVGGLIKPQLVFSLNLLTVLSALMSLLLVVTSIIICTATPPPHLPDLFVVAHNVVAFLAFGYYFMFANFTLWKHELWRLFYPKEDNSMKQKEE